MQLALDEMDDHLDAPIAIVKAGNVAELLTAEFVEDLLVLLGDLLERLDAIGGESRGDDGDGLHAVARQRLDSLVGVGLDPLGAAEARLKGELELGAERPKRLAQCLDGLNALC